MFNFKFESKSGTKFEFNFNGTFITIAQLFLNLHHPAIVHGISLVKGIIQGWF